MPPHGERQRLSLGRQLELVDRPSLTDLEGVRIEGHSTPDEIVPGAVPADEATTTRGRLRIPTERLQVRLDEAVAGRGVVVEQHQDVAGRGRRADVGTAGEAEVAAGVHHPHPRVLVRRHVDGSFGSAVVDQDDLDIGPFGVPRQRGDAVAEPLTAGVGDDHHRGLHRRAP